VKYKKKNAFYLSLFEKKGPDRLGYFKESCIFAGGNKIYVTLK
jgi:hypothetical protein